MESERGGGRERGREKERERKREGGREEGKKGKERGVCVVLGVKEGVEMRGGSAVTL